MTIIKACVRHVRVHTLQKVGHVLGSTAANEMFNKFILKDARIHYGEFMNDQRPFQSFGFLMSNVPNDKQHIVTGEQICAALIQLLKDQSSAVRAKAAEAMSVLHQY